MSNRIQAIQQVRDEVLRRIKTEKDAREFVLKELNAGNFGNIISRSFAEGSGIDLDILKGAKESSIEDVNGPGEFLSDICAHNTRKGVPREEVMMCRLAVVDLVMQHYLFGKYGRGKYNLIEKIVLEMSSDEEAEIFVYENFIVYKFMDADKQTYSINYFKHAAEKNNYFISPVYGYITIQSNRIIETSFENEEQIFPINERVKLS
ncbi:MAG: hypothetical protein ABFQ64_07125 [Campylobacterota bacterium]